MKKGRVMRQKIVWNKTKLFEALLESNSDIDVQSNGKPVDLHVEIGILRKKHHTGENREKDPKGQNSEKKSSI